MRGPLLVALVVLAATACSAAEEAAEPELPRAASNYRVLSETESRRLVRFAAAFYNCASRRIELGEPRPSRTRIVMQLESSATPEETARLVASCASSLGGPPKGASLVLTTRRAIELYLPKQCLLDPKVAAAKA